ncbi:head GIN domain-containing protein [Sphingorhabdus sp.]|uniref:head GIN domain-containing protein n=1 Tax=Sphingorhabdus sp. TaxID=1902408 RepID=UPI00391D006A
MRKALCLLPFLAISLSACGESVSEAVNDIKATEGNGFADGKVISATAATTDPFGSVKALGPDNIVFVTGDTFTIKAEGNAKAVATLRYKIDGDAIVIGREQGKWFGEEGKGVTVTITAPALSSASLAGSGDFTADRMTGDDVEVKIAGSGSLKVANVDAKKLETKIAGSGDAVIAGKVERADFSVLGSGSVDAQSLTAVDADISIAGSGDVRLNATGKVKAKVAGSGDINVTGGATCDSKSMGSGSISCS